MTGIFGNLFDLNGDGKLDLAEQEMEFLLFDHLTDEDENETNRSPSDDFNEDENETDISLSDGFDGDGGEDI